MKYKAIFLKKFGDKEFRKIGEEKYKEVDTTIRFKEDTYPIPKGVETFINKNTSYIFFQVGNSQVLTFVKTELGIDVKMLDKLVYQNILGKFVSQLRESMKEPNKWEIMKYLVPFIIGAFVGFSFALQYGG